MGGSKTAILAQVVHFYSDGVDHITIGGDKIPSNLPNTTRVLDNIAGIGVIRQMLLKLSVCLIRH